MNAANPEAPLENDATTSNGVSCHTRRCATAHETPCSCPAVLPCFLSIGPFTKHSQGKPFPLARVGRIRLTFPVMSELLLCRKIQSSPRSCHEACGLSLRR
jgi:hypothetical protein